MKNKTILFIANYPNAKNISDGMMQRIKHIDECFDAFTRIYLDIALYRNFSKSIEEHKKVTVYHVNLIIHFFLIFKIIKRASIIYIHSVYNGFRSFPFLRLYHKPKTVILDLHGIVPEELEFSGNNFLGIIMAAIEKELIKQAHIFIHVTNSMQQFYFKKYPYLSSKQNIVYPISPGTTGALDPVRLEVIRQSLNIHEGDVVFIYSGSAQKWQNVTLMLNEIKKLTNPNYRHIILSGELNKIELLANKVEIPLSKITLKNVHPSELAYYYQLAHYGFVLRDDHVLNRVANPTKLVEYLTFGITPIVMLEQIGDFVEMGYEYIPYQHLSNDMGIRKSEINRAIANQLMTNHKDIVNNILEDVH